MINAVARANCKKSAMLIHEEYNHRILIIYPLGSHSYAKYQGPCREACNGYNQGGRSDQCLPGTDEPAEIYTQRLVIGITVTDGTTYWYFLLAAHADQATYHNVSTDNQYGANTPDNEYLFQPIRAFQPFNGVGAGGKKTTGHTDKRTSCKQQVYALGEVSGQFKKGTAKKGESKAFLKENALFLIKNALQSLENKPVSIEENARIGCSQRAGGH